jgi:hypothetical protein
MAAVAANCAHFLLLSKTTNKQTKKVVQQREQQQRKFRHYSIPTATLLPHSSIAIFFEALIHNNVAILQKITDTLVGSLVGMLHGSCCGQSGRFAKRCC